MITFAYQRATRVWVGYYKQLIQEHRLKREGYLCHQWRRRKGLDKKMLLDFPCSFWVACRVFHLIRQPTPDWVYQNTESFNEKQHRIPPTCRSCPKVLSAAGALEESFEVREFRKKWSVPPLLLPMGNKHLSQPRCMVTEEQEMSGHCLPSRSSGKGARLVWKAVQQDTGDIGSALKSTEGAGRRIEK